MTPPGTTRKRIPLWARVTLVVVALVVVAGLVLPYFLDVGRYRTAIAVAVESQTGRKVSIGKIRAKFLPSVGFVVDDVHLGNPAGFAPGDLVSVEAIRGSLAWGPLLRKELQLSAIELVHPKLALLEDGRGQNNYTFASKPPAGKSGARGGASESPLRLQTIDSITLTGAEVTLGRVSSSTVVPTLAARPVDVTLKQVALDPLDVKRWTGKASLSGVQLTLAGWKEPLKFNSGQVKLAGGSLQAEFQAEMGKAADFKGAVQVADLEKGVANFQLTTKQLDVDQLVAAQVATPAAGARPVARPARSELVAQGRISAERLRWQPYSANNLSAELRIFTDRMEIWPLSLALYGGTLQVSARADRTQEPQRFSTNIQLRNIDVNGAFSAASPASRGKVSGTAEMDLQLIGSMSSNWQKSLSGSGKFTVRDGKLPGISSGGALGALAGGLNLKEIPYRTITGDLNVASERVASKDIHLDSPQGTIDLQGSFGLDSTLNYEGKVALASSGAVGGGQGAAGIVTGVLGQVLKRDVGKVTVPVSIRGTFADPKVMPGKGIPSFEGSQTPANSTTPQKKSILDLFKKQ